MAYTYEARDEAIEAAEMMEIDPASVARDHETGLWGWQDDDDALEGEIVTEDVASVSTALVPFGTVPSVPAETSAELVAMGAAAIGSAGEFKPRDGKLYAVILDGLTYDEAVALGVKIARRHKVDPAIADEPYFSNARIIDHTKLPAEPAPTKREKGKPTAAQQVLIDLCARPEGATTFELLAEMQARGLTATEKANATGWKAKLEDVVGRYRPAEGQMYVMGAPDARAIQTVDKKGKPRFSAVAVYRLVTVAAAANDADARKMAAD